LAPAIEEVDPRRWLALGILLAGAFLPPLDFFIVNVALPFIRSDLGASAASVQLVISAYAAAYAVCLIMGGRLGDLYGRKRVFLTGLAGFAIASALCGLAWSPAALVTGRVFQGVTAAVLGPQALASIHALFPPHEKPRAMGAYGVMFGLAAVAGQLLGGILIAASPFGLGWRAIFLINLPVVACAAPAGFFLLRETRGTHRADLDFGGAILLGAALSALVLPLVEGREQGWPAWSIASLIAFPFLLAGFFGYEAHVQAKGEQPLMPPSLFGMPGVRRGMAAVLCFYCLAAFFLTFPVYEQAGRGQGALATGLSILPFGLGLLLGPLTSPFFVRRLGTLTASVAICAGAGGLLLLASSVATETHALTLPALFIMGFGQGTALPNLIRVVLERVPVRWAGLGAGLINSLLQISASLSVAVLGGIFYAVLGSGTGEAPVSHAFVITLLWVGAFWLLCAWLIAGLRRAPPTPA
jgi:MFS family permease